MSGKQTQLTETDINNKIQKSIQENKYWKSSGKDYLTLGPRSKSYVKKIEEQAGYIKNSNNKFIYFEPFRVAGPAGEIYHVLTTAGYKYFNDNNQTIPLSVDNIIRYGIDVTNEATYKALTEASKNKNVSTYDLTDLIDLSRVKIHHAQTPKTPRSPRTPGSAQQKEKTAYQIAKDSLYQSLSQKYPQMSKKELNLEVNKEMKNHPNRKELLKASRTKPQGKRVKSEYQLYKEMVANEILQKVPNMKKSDALKLAKEQIQKDPELREKFKRNKSKAHKTPRTPRTVKPQSEQEQISKFEDIVKKYFAGKEKYSEKRYGINVSHYNGINHFGRKAEMKQYKDTIVATANGVEFPILVNKKGYDNFLLYLNNVVAKSTYANYVKLLDENVAYQLHPVIQQ